MGLWKPPAKVLLPSQHDQAPALFEYNGHLPDGTQLLAYLVAPSDGSLPPDASGRPGFRFLGAIHEFDADGHHKLVRTRVISGRYDGGLDYVAPANMGLRGMVAPYLAAGWRPGAIWVRPFLVQIDSEYHGLVFQASGEGLEGGPEEEREEVDLFLPFSCVFYPPYDTGSYDT